MSDVLNATSVAALWESIKAATPVETAIVAAIAATLYLVYTTLSR